MRRGSLPGAALLMLVAGAAGASRSLPASGPNLYVRARAAETNGDARAASAQFAALLAREPTSDVVAQRAYREALVAGDAALALRAAKLLDAHHVLPPDGRLLLAVEAVRAHDWAAARTATDGLEREKLFAFMAPILRAWIALGARDADPLVLIEAARAMPLAQPLYAEQRGLLLIALGRVEEGVTALRAPRTGSIDAMSPHVRLVAADALAATGQKERALALIDGNDQALVIATRLISAGKRLRAPVDRPETGIAMLLVRVSADLGRQRLIPVAFTFARLATFLAPQDASGWVVTADILGTLKRQTAAIASLDHIAADDPLAPAADALRVALLADMGRRDEALAEALRAARREGASFSAWARVGDVNMTLLRYGDAAAAYGRALDGAQAGTAPPAAIWPLLLQQGGALDLAGDWRGGRAALKAALALAPDQPMVLNQLGYSQIAHREDVKRASAMIERASKLRPDDAAITDSLGWVHYLRGDVADAVPLLEKAAAADPGEPTINEHLGDAYWSAGRRYEARYAWRAALVTAEDKDRARLSDKIDAGLSTATAAP